MSDLQQTLSPVLAAARAAGETVVPEWLRWHDERPDTSNFYGWVDFSNKNSPNPISDDAARLIALGAMAEWLGANGGGVHNERGRHWKHWIGDIENGGMCWGWLGPDATDCLSSHAAAVIARLAGKGER